MSFCHSPISARAPAPWPALALALVCGGCSFVFVTPPPSNVRQPTARPHVDCTTSKVAPILDGILTGYEIVRVVAAGVVDDSAYDRSPISRETDAALGVAFAGLFLGSTIYGAVSTSRCARLKQGPGPSEELPGITRDYPVEPALSPPPPARDAGEPRWQVDPQPAPAPAVP